MSLALLDEQTARELVLKKVNSNNFWVFVPDTQANDTVSQIEDEFYSGEFANDFDLIMTPIANLFGFYLAHKRRLSATQLADFLNERSSLKKVSADILEKQDFVFMFEDERQGYQAAIALNSWLIGKTAK